ncbi:MAG TPA: efflux RND transporter permease subunit [Streptosporangiaceae bacterium]
MVRLLVTLGTKFRLLVIGAAVIVCGLGLVQLRNAKVDQLPEFSPPLVQIQTEALGLSAAEIEQLVTVPLEQDLLNGVPWLDHIRSESRPGLSSIVLIFQPGTDLYQARQQVNERLTQAAALPSVGTPPVMLQPLSSTSRVLMIRLAAKNIPLVDLSVLARWKIKPRLMGVPGVAAVEIYGQRDRQLQVQVDPRRMRRHNVTLTQVIDTTGNALWVSPLTFVEASTPGTGGFIETGDQRMAIQHVLPITTAKDMAKVSLEGTNLKLADVADVVEGHQPLIGDAAQAGGSGLLLVVDKFPGADTREVTRDVEAAMAALEPGLAGATVDTRVYRPAGFLDTALGDLGLWTLIGVVLMGAVLAVAFFSWRQAAVAMFAGVLPVVAAAYVLYLRGTPFNMMVLAGFAVALTWVVDDAVTSAAGLRGAPDVVAAAAARLRGSLVYPTLAILAAAVPFALLGGTTGAFTRPLVLSYALAVGAATAVALVVTPAVAVVLLKKPSRREHWARRGIRRVLPRYLERPIWAVLTVALLGALAVPAAFQGGHRVLPVPHDRDLLVRLTAAPGTSLPEMARLTSAVAGQVEAVPGVRDTGAHVGRAILSDQVVGTDSGELWISLDAAAPYERTVARIRRIVHGFPGLRGELGTYPQDRLAAATAGSTADLTVRVYGPDLATLGSTAAGVSRFLAGIPGVRAPRVQAVTEQPTLEVTVDLKAAQKYGLTPGDIRRAAATFFAGLPAGNLYQEQKIFDVVVWSRPRDRRTPADVKNLLIDTPGGGHVRLADVASVRIAPFPAAIEHDATSRSLDVTAAVRGRGLSAVTHDVRAGLARLSMPQEYHAEVLGAALAGQRADRRTLYYALGAAMAVVLLVQAAFRRWRPAVLLLVALPLAAGPGVLATLGAGGITALGSLLGLFAVLALTLRHGVLLIRDFAESPLPQAVVEATADRAVPMVVTALGTAALLLPAAFAGGAPGAEVLHPFAVVTIAGLAGSLVFSLFLLPALYVRLGSPGTAGPDLPRPRAGGEGGSARRAVRRTVRRTGRRRPSALFIAALAAVAAIVLPVSACGPRDTTGGELDQAPDRIVPIEGTDRHQVILTADGAARVGIRTEPIRRIGRHSYIPVGAVVYAPDGKTWAYTSPAALTYERVPIRVGRVGDGLAVLRSGPRPGTAVVSVGSAELYGAEYGVGGEQ